MPDEHTPISTTTQRRLGGRYVLLEEVGRGGMAIVHRAHDEVLDRPVAVKLLHPHLAFDDAFLDRFRREARAAGALSHPNIVAVHDWGESADGAFLVLQLVDGLSLRDLLRARERLTPNEALAIIGPAAAGLGAAHAAGLVHRDVKPENLLIGRDGTVRVTDFGLARAAASATTTFGPDVLVGSPHYLSPEAVHGEPLDPRADVYALGVVLFECLTGRPPHEGESPMATAVAHTARAVPAPSSVRADLDPEIDEVVLRATARDRAARYPDTASLARALILAVPGPAAPVPVPTEVTRPAEDAPDPGDTAVVPITDTATAVVSIPDSATEVLGAEPPAPPPPPIDEEDTTPLDRRRRRRWPLLLALLIALIAGSAVGGYLLWDRVLAPVTPIPSVLGADEASAVEQLERVGFEVEIADEGEHALSVPDGHVLTQEPEGTARAGTTVELVLSAGPRPVEVPSVAGETASDAVALLEAADLSPLETETHHDSVPEGRVITTDPASGAVVDEASEVEVLVSLGPAPIAIPDVTEEPVGEARALLEDLGLELEVVERRHDDDVPADRIIDQEPAGSEELLPGGVVRVVVSDGPEPIELPNVRGQRVGEAVETLEALGLDVEVERRGGFSAFFNPDQVYDQDPGPGSTRLPGETVVLYAYEG
ncbi:MAG: PASTA domain-containing protein [Nitriliruptoraceae bacterium]